MSRAKKTILSGVCLFVASIIALAAWPGTARAAILIEQVSLTSLNGSPVGNCAPEAVSQDGRYVVFYTLANNVVPGDTNIAGDVFVRDRVHATTERVSVSSAEVEGNDWSSGAAISADGRYVVFDSIASNLGGGGDTNNEYDVFVRDREFGLTEQVSVSSAEVKGNDRSRLCAISADGRYVVFYSEATNLVTGDTNGYQDVFVRDRDLGTTTRVSVRSDSTQGNGDSYGGAVSDHGGDISDNGRYVVFVSEANNLVTGDTNGVADVFVRDMTTGSITRVSVNSSESQANGASQIPSMSSTGRYVVFESTATNLITGDTNGVKDIFIRDTQNGTTDRISVTNTEGQATGLSAYSSISANGRYVAFQSDAANLVTGDTDGFTDVFVRDRWANATRRISVAEDGSEPNAFCAGARMSRDGSLITFDSEATNLTSFDSGGFWQAYGVRTPGSVSYTSIRGVDRFDTAIRISQAMFPAALPADSGVVLAPGWESYQEALCGAPLAASYGGPVLLSAKTVLYANVRDELIRLAPDHVFCIGLTGTAVATAVQAALPGAVVTMINGTDVYHMSYLVALALRDRVNSTGGNTSCGPGIVTIGSNFPDAIGLSALACRKKWPILLTDYYDDRPMNTHAVNAMNALGITTYVKAGTYAPDPPGITGIGNCSGADRYYTNAMVAAWSYLSGDLTFSHLVFTTGDKFPDALAAGPYLAGDDGTVMLSPLDGPLPGIIALLLDAVAGWVHEVSYIACIEPVISEVKVPLP